MTGNLAPADRMGVRLDAWRAECRLLRLSQGEADAQRMAFNRAKDRLVKSRVIGTAGEWAWRVTDD